MIIFLIHVIIVIRFNAQCAIMDFRYCMAVLLFNGTFRCSQSQCCSCCLLNFWTLYMKCLSFQFLLNSEMRQSYIINIKTPFPLTPCSMHEMHFDFDFVFVFFFILLMRFALYTMTIIFHFIEIIKELKTCLCMHMKAFCDCIEHMPTKENYKKKKPKRGNKQWQNNTKIRLQ